MKPKTRKVSATALGKLETLLDKLIPCNAGDPRWKGFCAEYDGELVTDNDWSIYQAIYLLERFAK